MKCESCGAAVSPRDVELGSCGYCNSPLRGAVDEAAKQAALAELMADRDGDGVPDALAAMQAQQAEQQARQALQNKVALLRRQAEQWSRARFRPVHLAWLVPLLVLVLGTVWFLLTVVAADVDPWLGAHARTTCPDVCQGCKGPYVYHSWTTTTISGGSRSSNSTTLVYCRHPDTGIGELGWSDMHSLRGDHEPYRLKGGLWRLWGVSLLVWLLPALALAAGLMLRSVRKRRAGVPGLEQQVRDLEAKLAASADP